MKTFYIFHAIYLSGGLTAYAIQFLYFTKVQKIEWTKEPSFKAAMTSFFSWAYVLAFGGSWLFSKRMLPA